jgi:hypothetical protein
MAQSETATNAHSDEDGDPMTDGDTANDDLRAELERLDTEIDELGRNIRDVRGSLSDGGPMDSEDRSTALTQVEELDAVRTGLERRRDAIREQLGS